MKNVRTFLISVVVILIALLSLLLWVRSRQAQPPAALPQTEESLPTSSGNAAPSDTLENTAPFAARTIPISLSNGKVIMVKDFMAEAVPDQNNKNTSYLAGEDAQGVVYGTPYVIQFISTDNSFTIGLMQEPLRDWRGQAENDLMGKLGVTAKEMCALRYVVLVPFEVSEVYAGRNLGFSFCPGAAQLP